MTIAPNAIERIFLIVFFPFLLIHIFPNVSSDKLVLAMSMPTLVRRFVRAKRETNARKMVKSRSVQCFLTVATLWNAQERHRV